MIFYNYFNCQGLKMLKITNKVIKHATLKSIDYYCNVHKSFKFIIVGCDYIYLKISNFFYPYSKKHYLVIIGIKENALNESVEFNYFKFIYTGKLNKK